MHHHFFLVSTSNYKMAFINLTVLTVPPTFKIKIFIKQPVSKFNITFFLSMINIVHQMVRSVNSFRVFPSIFKINFT